MTYTLKVLARRIASDSSDEAAATAARRIEHWASSWLNLFNIAGVDLGPKDIGRGRVRKYPEESLSWCVLWAALADLGLGLIIMSVVTHAIRVRLDEKSQEARWLHQAMRGEGATLFLFEEMHAEKKKNGIHQNKIKFARSPIKLTDDWFGGLFVNLTAIYARAAKK